MKEVLNQLRANNAKLEEISERLDALNEGIWLSPDKVRQVREALEHVLSEYMHWVKPQREAAGWPDGGPYWQEAEAAVALLSQSLMTGTTP